MTLAPKLRLAAAWTERLRSATLGFVTDSQRGPHVGQEPAGSMVSIAEKDGELTIEIPRPDWDANLYARAAGGLILLAVGLLRGWVVSISAPNLPTVIAWFFPIAGAWLLGHTLWRAMVATRVRLAPGSGAVEWSLGPMPAYTEIDTRTLEVRSECDDEAEGDLRLVFLEPRGNARRIRILRGRSAAECERVAAAIGAWIRRQPPGPAGSHP